MLFIVLVGDIKWFILLLVFNNNIKIAFGRSLNGSLNSFNLPVSFSNTNYIVTVGGNYDMTSHLHYVNIQTVSTLGIYGNQAGNYKNWFICIGY